MLGCKKNPRRRVCVAWGVVTGKAPYLSADDNLDGEAVLQSMISPVMALQNY